MKKLLGIVVLGLFLITPSQADDISDFEIEGISIGDTLLQFATNEEINISENNSSIMKDKNGKDRFIIIFLNTIQLQEYEDLQITYKINDKNYIIHAIDGGINFPDDFEKCKNTMNKVVIDLENIFTKIKPRNLEGKHLADEYGESIHKSTYFDLSNGTVHIWCTLWGDKMNSTDGLSVSLRSKEYTYFLKNDNSY
tara:strand:+ start:315 stop:902 length:588 start_codon:yes stop_codon:yes gene_type:complete